MTLQYYAASIEETTASENDNPGTPRLSARLSLLFLVGTSALGYALAYQAVSLIWGAVAGG